MFKVNNKTPKRRRWFHSGVFKVNFELVNAGWENVSDKTRVQRQQ